MTSYANESLDSLRAYADAAIAELVKPSVASEDRHDSASAATAESDECAENPDLAHTTAAAAIHTEPEGACAG